MQNGSTNRFTIPIKNLDREEVSLKPTTTRKITDEERRQLEAKLDARKQIEGSYLMQNPKPADIDLSQFEVIKPNPTSKYGMAARLTDRGLVLYSELGQALKCSGVTLRIDKTGDTILMERDGPHPLRLCRLKAYKGIRLHGKKNIAGALTARGVPLNSIYDFTWNEGLKALVGKRRAVEEGKRN